MTTMPKREAACSYCGHRLRGQPPTSRQDLRCDYCRVARERANAIAWDCIDRGNRLDHLTPNQRELYDEIMGDESETSKLF